MNIRLVSLLAVSLFALTACRHAEVKPPPPSPKAREFYPLKVGNHWTYEIRAAGQTVERTISIVSQKDGFFVDNTGAELKHDDTGLRDRNRYLLENPVEAGRKWLSVQSVRSTEHFEITSAGSGCSTRAGTFADCVTVQSTAEVRPGRKLIIESTYAKGVGLVSLQTLQIEGSSAPQTQLELELVSYNVTP